LVFIASCTPQENTSPGQNAPKATLAAFTSDEELLAYLKKVRPEVPPLPAPPAAANGAVPEAVTLTASKSADENITNVQEAGVDEGGIVKVRGDILVILRRGRLFTVSTKGGGLEPVDTIEAYPPGVDPSDDWYDEMLIAGDRVIVVGFSYGRGGTEINRFRISDDGKLSFEDSNHLRSNDYYSSRNYASRLVGNKLIFYTPLYLPYSVVDLVSWLPAIQHWKGPETTPADFKRIASAEHVYLPEIWRTQERAPIAALHTVTICDLALPSLQCTATSVLGPAGRTFYVSPHAVYVWLSQWEGQGPEGPSILCRLPLDGGAPSAIGVRGAPLDQFSFREDWDDGRLNVLVLSEGGGDAMWNPEFAMGAAALLQLPLAGFGTGAEEALRSQYRKLPTPAESGYDLQNRFVGDYLLYGTGNTWGSPRDQSTALVAVEVDGDEVTTLALNHGADRIEAMGRDAVVIGADSKNLYFSAVELTKGPQPGLGDRYTLKAATQGETRSHGFFFKADPQEEAVSGVLGLPVARAARPGYEQLFENSVAIIFLRRAERKFSGLGELMAKDENAADDSCKASCVDWYGNARPIFLGQRTFALLGYELVEGKVTTAAIQETRRISFAPKVRPAQ
jgi:hypothetical protein